MKINLLLLAALISLTKPCLAVDAQETDTKPRNEVTELLNKLKLGKTPKAAAPNENQAPTPKPTKKRKPVSKPTIAVPEPVVITPASPLTVEAPVKKRSLPDFVHNIYIRGDYGVGMPNKIGSGQLGIRFKKTPMYSGGLGYKFNQAVRADINFQSRKLERKNKSTLVRSAINTVKHSSTSLNTYIQLMDENSYIIPYFTAGVGYAQNKVRDFSKSLSNTAGTVIINSKGSKTKDIIWNAGFGAAFVLTKHLRIEGNYKFIDIGKLKWYSATTVISGSGTGTFTDTLNKRQYVHEIAGGIVINF